MIPRPARIVAAVLLLSPLVHAQGRGQVGVIGTVSAAYQMEPVFALSRTGAIVSLEETGPSELRIRVESESAGSRPHEAVLVFALRTNAPIYRITAISNQAEPVKLTLAAVGKTGTGALVAPSALSDFQAAAETAIFQWETDVASGTRVSLRGRFPSPDNAMLIEVRMKFPPTPSKAVVILRLGA